MGKKKVFCNRLNTRRPTRGGRSSTDDEPSTESIRAKLFDKLRHPRSRSRSRAGRGRTGTSGSRDRRGRPPDRREDDSQKEIDAVKVIQKASPSAQRRKRKKTLAKAKKSSGSESEQLEVKRSANPRRYGEIVTVTPGPARRARSLSLGRRGAPRPGYMQGGLPSDSDEDGGLLGYRGPRSPVFRPRPRFPMAGTSSAKPQKLETAEAERAAEGKISFEEAEADRGTALGWEALQHWASAFGKGQDLPRSEAEDIIFDHDSDFLLECVGLAEPGGKKKMPDTLWFGILIF